MQLVIQHSDLDAGAYLEKFCLGDYIWEDTNMNGIQDDGESGIADVTITLNETNATTTTDENGSYEFCGLEAGDYSITVDKTTLPDGYVIRLKMLVQMMQLIVI